jgi:hypothetical protein
MKPSFPQHAYDLLADAYASKTDTKSHNAHNAYYERQRGSLGCQRGNAATKSLIGEVTGLRTLDAGLAITYVQNLKGLFAEFRRVLRDRGWFVFSTEHPSFSCEYFKVGNYFDTKEVSCDWKGFGEKVRMPSYYHSLGTICDALADNGFVIERILEPKPTEEFRRADAEEYQKLLQFPLFVCIRARKIA